MTEYERTARLTFLAEKAREIDNALPLLVEMLHLLNGEEPDE